MNFARLTFERLSGKCFLGGKWHAASPTLAVLDPCTHDTLGAQASLDVRTVRECMRQASTAGATWARKAVQERHAHLVLLATNILSDLDQLSELIVLESGKPRSEAEGEVRIAAEFIRAAAEYALRVQDRLTPRDTNQVYSFVRHRPFSTILAVTPWNYPLALIARKLGSALAAGSAMVVKPSEKAPFSALRLAEHAEAAGIDSGQFSVITGDAQTLVTAALDSGLVSRLSFTGSKHVGRIVAQQAARHLIPAALELGGQAPFIVHDDADVGLAACHAVAVKFRNAGQTCVAPTLFMVHESLLDTFLSTFVDAAKALRLGSGLSESATMGPLIDDDGVSKALNHIQNALNLGSKLLIGGTKPSGPGLARGSFLNPTVLRGWVPTMDIANDETFGPVAAIQSFADEDAMMDQISATRGGLAAYVYTQRASRAFRAMEEIPCGILCINDISTASPYAPLGGIGDSGFGREAGPEGLMENLQATFVRWYPG